MSKKLNRRDFIKSTTAATALNPTWFLMTSRMRFITPTIFLLTGIYHVINIGLAQLVMYIYLLEQMFSHTGNYIDVT
jgi:hypothetical protein